MIYLLFMMGVARDRRLFSPFYFFKKEKKISEQKPNIENIMYICNQ
jgi:hypothetical protein